MITIARDDTYIKNILTRSALCYQIYIKKYRILINKPTAS